MAWKLSHVQLIILLALLTRLATLLLLSFLHQLPAFDTSHLILSHHSPSTLRWDAVHFTSIALNGYEYEQQLVFQPGWPGVMRLAGRGVSWVKGGEMGVEEVVLGGMVVSNLAFVGASVMLYKLTFRLTTPSFALMTSLFYLLPPTPAVLSSPYTEPLFALLTFTGFYLALQRRWSSAAISLAGATSMRATGVFAAPVLWWMMVSGIGRPDNPSQLVSRSLRAGPACLVIVAPFVAFQYYAYASFCSSPDTTRPWCDARFPLAYSSVQGEYWNVGFLKYWTPAQLPNLLIAAPGLAVSLTGTYQYLENRFRSDTGTTSCHKHQAFLSLHLHHLAMTLLLIFSSHTQIALRVISGDPVVWWNVAAIAFDWSGTKQVQSMTKAGKAWLWWTVIWGAVSLVLWAGHYPPA